MVPKFTYERRERSGHGVGDDIHHYFTSDTPATKAQATEWVKWRGYFGYHPAGYGGHIVTLGPTTKDDRYTRFTWVHWASCD